MGHVGIVSSERSGSRHAETRGVQRKEEKFEMFLFFFFFKLSVRVSIMFYI